MEDKLKEAQDLASHLKYKVQIMKHKITSGLTTMDELYKFLADIEEKL